MTKTLLIVLSGVLGTSQARAQAIESGRKQFEGRCAGCHGADANGGERGPGILDLRHGRSQNLREIIRNGIPDAGMPPFQIPDGDVDQLLAFIGSLSAPAADHPADGNAEAGRQFFAGKGGCASCHMISGRGGVVGPDLSDLGRERRLGQIEQALRSPGSLMASNALGVMPASYKVVSVRLRDGRTLRGLAKNETNWDLQLQGLDGALHLLDKVQIVEEIREPKSLMPPLQATVEETRDLLAYLSRLTSEKTAALPAAGSPPVAAGGVSFADLVHPKPGEWPTYDGQLSGNRHSPLNQITAANVSQLAPRWIFTIPNARRLEVTPLVVTGVMYVTTANEAYALDAATGRQIWHYGRPLTKGVIGDAAGAKNRGVAVLGDRVFLVTDNAHMLALHRLTGQLLWDTEMADYRQHYGATSAPLVIKNLVLSGTSGGDEGARGFVDAYRVSTGERAWRFWLTPAPGEPLS